MDAYTSNPPLSYSLPAWHPGGYRDAQWWIDDLRSLGFRWITFTPTYLVYDEAGSLALMFRADHRWQNCGLRSGTLLPRECPVKLGPRLDFETTLTGGPSTIGGRGCESLHRALTRMT